MSVLDAARICGHAEAHFQPSGSYPLPSLLVCADSGLDGVRPGSSQVPLGTHTALPHALQDPQESVRVAQGPRPQTLPLFRTAGLSKSGMQGGVEGGEIVAEWPVSQLAVQV